MASLYPQQQQPPPPPQPMYPAAGSGGYYAAAGPAPGKIKSPMRLWWPLGALVAWVLLLAAGGGLIGGAFSKGTTRTCSNPYYTYACRGTGPDRPMLIAGIALCALAAICHLVFWVLLIAYFVKRYDARHHHLGPQNMVFYAQPGPMYGWQQQPMDCGMDETAASPASAPTAPETAAAATGTK